MLEHILLALRFLKRNIGMIHSDIKPENILKMDDGNYCITDFGISKIIEKKVGSNTITTSMLKTKNIEGLSKLYAAPEIL
jgi:serine/threonine protein kinase